MQKKISIIIILFSIAFSGIKSQINSIGGDSLKIDFLNQKEYEIGGITVSGGDNLDRNVLVLLSGLNIGDKVQVPGDKFANAVENLWKQGLFDDIQITATSIKGNNIFLNIYVLEKPRLSKFTFRGVKKSDADDIRDKVKLIKGKVLTDYLLSSTSSSIQEHYIAKGYPDVKIELKQEKDLTIPNSNTLYIIVNKGDRVKIQDIIIHGNTEFKSKKLRRKMKETRRKRWYSIFKASKFLEENYEKDKQKIIDKYLDKGYRDVKIIKDTTYKVKPNRINVEFTIDEGRKYFFKNISWIGNTKYTNKELSQILGIKKGDIFNQSVLDSKLFMNPNGADVTSLYMDDGYLFFQVIPMEVMVENDSIDLEMRIYEGKQARINKVTVVGNDRTNDHVIMREIRTKPGELFSRNDIIRSQRDLAQLGYFDAEKLGVATPNTNPTTGTVDIEYQVEEKASDQIELSGGFGGNRIVGTLGVSFTNFSARNIFKKDTWRPLPSGDGQRLSIRAQSYGLGYQSYNMSFSEPWLGGKKPISLTTSLFRSIQSNGAKRKITVDGQKVDNPDRRSLNITGGSIGLGKRLKWPDDLFQLYQDINYQYYDLNNFGSVFSFSNGYSNNIFYRIAISRNSVDKPIFETKGSNISFSAQFTPPYSLFRKDSLGNEPNYETMLDQDKYKFIEYHKYKFVATWFTQLTNKRAAEGKEARNLVLSTKMGFGMLTMFNKKLGLSPFERYYLGGSGLSGFALDGREVIALRGYDDNSLSPSTGSAFLSKFSLELRYPISLNPSATIYALTFAEAGNAYNKFKEFNPFSLKKSAGVGLRVFLPMFGLLGFDYGWGFDTVEGNPNTGRQLNGKPKGQFHFTIGAALGDL